MPTHTLEIEIETDEDLTGDDMKALRSVIEHGTVPDALRMKVPSAEVKEARVSPGAADHTLRDVRALESFYEEANEEAAEPFEVDIEKGEHLRLCFSRESEANPRVLLLEQHEDDLRLFIASEEAGDPDVSVKISKDTTTVSGITGQSQERTFNGTKRVG